MSEKLIIQGGKPLQGTVKIPGAKNSALPLLASTLLTDKPVKLTNVPELNDVQTMLSMVRKLGKDITTNSNSLQISGPVTSNKAPVDLVRKMRASFLILAPLVGRTGEATVPIPGGCNIGTRPVDLHLEGLKKLGVKIKQEDGRIFAQTERIIGNDVFLNYPSVGATEQLIMATVVAEGNTTIYNGAQEPEIRDLVSFLRSLGADISMNGSIIKVNGVNELGKTTYRVLPDRIAAGTYMIAGTATNGNVEVTDVDTSSLKPLSLKLKKAGITVKEAENTIKVKRTRRPDNLEIITLPFPGFPTDLQAPITALLTLANGKSVVKETVFDSRFGHVPELSKMGADISTPNSNTVFIKGKKYLRGTKVEATDIRAGAALVIGGLAAKGETVVSGLDHLDRGYSKLVENLRTLGADVERIK